MGDGWWLEENRADDDEDRGRRPPATCKACGSDDILDDRTGLCVSCHVGPAVWADGHREGA